MADVTQETTVLLAHQLLTNADTAAGKTVKGTEKLVSSYLEATIRVYHALIEAAANDPGVQYIFQGRSGGASENEDWVDIWRHVSATAAGVKADITGAEAAGETTLAVDADPTSAFSTGDIVYIKDVTLSEGEWARVAHSETAANIVTILDGLTNAKGSSGEIWSGAEAVAMKVDLSGFNYVRMIVIGTDTTGANIHFKAEMIAFTDIE